MRLLLDTHVVIWWDSGSPLSADAMKAIASADEVFVSAASAWEVEIKRALGKLQGARAFSVAVSDSGFTELPVRFVHAEALATLPPLHRDPFDRLLVAQALTDGLTLVTRDPQLWGYNVSVIRA